ncbi:MarR family winged helix-turn-helix transcriptional regulator [Caldicellulosiruptor naganoensis]|uniref:MarR family transcriptional regulator n=1 Tax=Caldicellulosiruptor naganoensis TaxID=29324 RepID=A0ABY7BHG4_9FIRM|nr:MarR family transcriptional regulator [Caldicellulosiruptor naganoensis]WAM31843.1 MarR family transcriptional regulator [Caldicellulosiruptor naganoensis]
MENECEEKLIFEILGTIRRKLNNRLKNEELFDYHESLTFGEQQVIMVLSENSQPMTMKDIASELGISPSTLTGIVDKLVEKELVKREIDLQDRRKVQVFLTENGKNLVEKIIEFRSRVLEPILKNLSPEEIDLLKKIVQKINEAL